MPRRLRLGVNVDHVATLRQARRESFPSPGLAALEAQRAGAHSITLHLREDRRHIQESDLADVRRLCRIPINLEMALHPEVVKIALRFRPEKVCLVPEKRQEVTTEGGLNLIPQRTKLMDILPVFRKLRIETSLFIDPDPRQIEIAAEAGAYAVEFHTGTYAHARGAARARELKRIAASAGLARGVGLHVHAGHGLDYDNVKPVAGIREIEELNIGFSIVGRALFTGMYQAVRAMLRAMRTSA